MMRKRLFLAKPTLVFFTRDSLKGTYGTSVHLFDFFSDISKLFKIRVFQLSTNPGKVFSFCDCPAYFSVNTFNVYCLGRKFHFDLEQYSSKFLLKFLRIFSGRLNLVALKSLIDANRESLGSRVFFDDLPSHFETLYAELVDSQVQSQVIGINYSWLAPLLKDKKGIKFALIHDIRNRNQKLAKYFPEMKFFGGLEGEFCFLSLADCIVTVNNNDAFLLRNMLSQAKVLVVRLSNSFHPRNRVTNVVKRSFVVCFIDGGGLGDFHIREFLLQVWKPLVTMFPDMELRIGGSICHLIEDLRNLPGVKLVASVSNLESFYEGANLSIVPHYYRGGIKIKMFESLKYGVPVAASNEACDGFPRYLQETISPLGLQSFIHLITMSRKRNLYEDYYSRQAKAFTTFLDKGYLDFEITILELLEDK